MSDHKPGSGGVISSGGGGGIWGGGLGGWGGCVEKCPQAVKLSVSSSSGSSGGLFGLFMFDLHGVEGDGFGALGGAGLAFGFQGLGLVGGLGFVDAGLVAGVVELPAAGGQAEQERGQGDEAGGEGHAHNLLIGCAQAASHTGGRLARAGAVLGT